jgi:drug/metabolite transporter (DMT)-like permease
VSVSVRAELRQGSATRRRVSGWPVRFLALAAIWGMSFLFIKVGDGSFAPLQLALLRVALGTGTLLGIVAVRGDRLPVGLRVWGHLLVASLLLNVLPFAFFAYGEMHVTSILAGIWNGSAPLWTTIVAVSIYRTERPTWVGAVGISLGFVGVLVVLGGSGFGSGTLLGNLLCLGAAVCYGLGYPYARRFLTGLDVSLVALSAAQLMCATAVLLAAVLLTTSVPHTVTSGAVVSVVALGILGTGVAYVLNYSLIREAGATAASTVTYLVPLFATIVGVVALREPLTINEPIGGAIVVLGVVLSQRWGRRPA